MKKKIQEKLSDLWGESRRALRKLESYQKYFRFDSKLCTQILRFPSLGVFFVGALRLLVRILVLSHVLVVAVGDARRRRGTRVNQILRRLRLRHRNRSRSREFRRRELLVLDALLVSVRDGRLVRQKHRRRSEHVTERVILQIQEGRRVQIRVAHDLTREESLPRARAEQRAQHAV